MKERITVTIEHSLLKTVDASIDGVQVKNRSHAIELLLERALKQVMPTKAVILAGGEARNLLKPVHGKPVIVHNLLLVSSFGINDVIILTNKHDSRVKDFLGDGSKYDVAITYAEESEPLGTAGSLNIIREKLTEPFVLLNGDELKNIEMRDMYAFHKQQRGLCTIALTSVADPSQYGVALLNGNKVVAFIEKPSAKNAPSNLVSAGLYIMEPAVLTYIPKGFGRVETDVFPKLAKDEQLIGYPFSGQYLDEEPTVPERLTALWRGWR